MNVLNTCTLQTIQSPAELLASSRPSPLAATSSCATLWHAVSHMLQQAWLQRAWNVLVTTSRQVLLQHVQHVAKCHNFWNHFSMTMQELQVCFGLFNAKGVSTYNLFQSQLTFFGPYHTLQFLLRVIHSDLGGCLCTTSCTSCAQHCPTLTWYEKVWRSEHHARSSCARRAPSTTFHVARPQ